MVGMDVRATVVKWQEAAGAFSSCAKSIVVNYDDWLMASRYECADGAESLGPMAPSVSWLCSVVKRYKGVTSVVKSSGWLWEGVDVFRCPSLDEEKLWRCMFYVLSWPLPSSSLALVRTSHSSSQQDVFERTGPQIRQCGSCRALHWSSSQEEQRTNWITALIVVLKLTLPTFSPLVTLVEWLYWYIWLYQFI